MALASPWHHMWNIFNHLRVGSTTIDQEDQAYIHVLAWCPSQNTNGSSRTCLTAKAGCHGASRSTGLITLNKDHGKISLLYSHDFGGIEASELPRCLLDEYWFWHKRNLFGTTRKMGEVMSSGIWVSICSCFQSIRWSCVARSNSSFNTFLEEAPNHYLEDNKSFTIVRRLAPEDTRNGGREMQRVVTWFRRPLDTVLIYNSREEQVLEDINEFLRLPNFHYNMQVSSRARNGSFRSLRDPGLLALQHCLSKNSQEAWPALMVRSKPEMASWSSRTSKRASNNGDPERSISYKPLGAIAEAIRVGACRLGGLKDGRKVNHFAFQSIQLVAFIQGVLAFEDIDPAATSFKRDENPTTSTQISRGWPIESGWPPINGWPFAAFGLLSVAVALIAMLSRRANNAAVSGIGMAVAAFIGFTILGDKPTTATITWTIVTIELFFSFAYAVVQRKKHQIGPRWHDMGAGWCMVVFCFTMVFAMISITSTQDDKAGVRAEVYARCVPPSFSLSILICCSCPLISGSLPPGRHHFCKRDGYISVQETALPTTCQCQQCANYGCDLNIGMTLLRQQEEGQVPHTQECSQPATDLINGLDPTVDIGSVPNSGSSPLGPPYRALAVKDRA